MYVYVVTELFNYTCRCSRYLDLLRSPYYSVRVNSQDHGHTLGLSPGAVLYVVPASLELTHYVFTRELVKLVFFVTARTEVLYVLYCCWYALAFYHSVHELLKSLLNG